MKKIVIISLLLFCFTNAVADDYFKISQRIVAGLNLGGSSPIPVPNRLSNLTWSPRFSPEIGWYISFLNDRNFGFTSGARLEQKGMSVSASVYQLHTRVNIDGLETNGYFTGINETDVEATYLTIPILATYSPSPNWMLDFGVFGAWKLSGQFDGAVKNGYLRETTPTGSRTDIDYETFEFDNEIRKFDYGIEAGATRQVYRKLSLRLDMKWSLSSLLNANFTGIEYKLYNIYVGLGVSYSL